MTPDHMKHYQLCVVIETLCRMYGTGQAKLILTTPSDLLCGQVPVELIRLGRGEEVLRMMEFLV